MVLLTRAMGWCVVMKLFGLVNPWNAMVCCSGRNGRFTKGDVLLAIANGHVMPRTGRGKTLPTPIDIQHPHYGYTSLDRI